MTVLEDEAVIRVGSLQGPGISGSNLWLLKDPTPASAIPGYTWPASLAAAAVQSNSSFDRAGAQQQGSQSGLSTAAQAAIGVCVSVVGVLAIALGALFCLRHRRKSTQPGLLPKSGPPSADSSILGDVAVDACGRRSPDSKTGAGRCVASVRDASLVADISARQSSRAAAKSTARTGIVDRRSTDGSSAAAASDCLPGSKAATGTDTETQSGSGGSSVEHSIAQGLQRWSAAVSATTMQLMKRRLEVNNASALFPGSSTSASGSNSGRIPAVSSMQVPAGAFTGTCADGQGTDSPAGASRIGSDGSPALHLQQVIGTGSFGSVYLASWRGKQVAVKVMHLPADALTEPLDQQQAIAEEEEDDSDNSTDATDSVAHDARQQQQQQLRQRRQWQRQQNSPPHMAIMEAVVSSTMSHPNVSVCSLVFLSIILGL